MSSNFIQFTKIEYGKYQTNRLSKRTGEGVGVQERLQIFVDRFPNTSCVHQLTPNAYALRFSVCLTQFKTAYTEMYDMKHSKVVVDGLKITYFYKIENCTEDRIAFLLFRKIYSILLEFSRKNSFRKVQCFCS